MSRFDQRLKKKLKNREFAAGYAEMDAQIQFLRALDRARLRLHISKTTLAKRLGRARPSVSRLFTTGGANPTLETIMAVLAALRVQARIQIRKARSKDPSITVETKV